MSTNVKLKTAQAADIAGVGYECFRTWLKRGLLKQTGIMPKFYAADAPEEVVDSKRWRWSSFGFADLCSFRMTKLLLDAGLSWEMVSSVVSENEVWKCHRYDDTTRQYLAIFPASAQWTLYSAEALADELKIGILKGHPIMLIDLCDLRKTVVLRTRSATLRFVANDLKATSDISARSGSRALAPDERTARKTAIETLAFEMSELADEAEKGWGSYSQFERILRQLHSLGKFPDNSTVADVADAFTL